MENDENAPLSKKQLRNLHAMAMSGELGSIRLAIQTLENLGGNHLDWKDVFNGVVFEKIWRSFDLFTRDIWVNKIQPKIGIPEPSRFDQIISHARHMTYLAPEAARYFAQAKAFKLDFGFKEISIHALKELAHYRGHYRGRLSLSGLSILELPEAKILGKANCSILYLDGITELSPSQAKALGKFQGEVIFLRNMKHLPKELCSNETVEVVRRTKYYRSTSGSFVIGTRYIG